MRTGAEYRRALHDGRRIWVVGEGLVECTAVTEESNDPDGMKEMEAAQMRL